jgi:hypothetical protein
VVIKPKSVFCELREVKVIRDGFEFDDQRKKGCPTIPSNAHGFLHIKREECV